jgi:hypothetical protein
MNMIEVPSARQDKFGFYQVGDFRTYSKFEAIEQHVKTNKKIHWNFNDTVYASCDWTHEPEESLSKLYCQRAQQLREQYDHLVLWFSGGADSTNILNTFVNNNIKLDEVASYVNYKATGDQFNYLNAEIYHVARPVVESAKQKQPWLQHTVIDLADLTVEYFNNISAKFDWIYQVNGFVNPNAAARRDIKLKIPHWTKMFGDGKKVGFIYGIDKPWVSRVNGHYYLKFIDMLDNAVSAECQMLNRDWDFNELFYWASDNPKIVVKQAHTIKKYLKSVTESSPFIISNLDQASTVSIVINKKIHWLTLPGLHTLIYPGWTQALYQGKPLSLTFSPRDTWFFNLPNLDPAKYAWRVALEHRWNSTPNYFKTDRLQIASGFKQIPSSPYYLGT